MDLPGAQRWCVGKGEFPPVMLNSMKEAVGC